MRLATYNMFWGLDGRGLIKHLLGQYRMHRGFDYLREPKVVKHDDASIAKVVDNSTLSDVFDRIYEANAYVVALQETLPGVHGDELRIGLLEMGYKHISWGSSGHNSWPLTMSSMLASKMEGESLESRIRYSEFTGTGGGTAATYYPSENVTVINAHLAIGPQPKDREPQIDRLVEFVHEERAKKRKVALLGDLNMSYADLCKHDGFRNLGFYSTNLRTMPSWNGPMALLFMLFKSYGAFDQVMVHPDEYQITNVFTIKGRADHRMLVCDVQAT